MSTPKRQRTSTVPAATVRNDSLGKLIYNASTRLQNASSWDSFITSERGCSHLQSNIAERTQHPAGTYLDRLASNGVPVLQSTPPWTPDQLLHSLARGSHQSAHSHLDFLREEMAMMIEQQYWTVLPYSKVKHLPHLRLSPLGVVPQRDRRPRIIVDYSYYTINNDTVPLAPSESMQFGRALDRILYKIRHANRRFGPVHMIKVDIADGFYRMWVSASCVPTLGVIFPHLPGEEPLVAFPLVLPMGWVSSPPYFCALTETVADIANQKLWDRTWHPNTHKLSCVADAATNFQPVTRRPAATARPGKLQPVLLPAQPLPQPRPQLPTCTFPRRKAAPARPDIPPQPSPPLIPESLLPVLAATPPPLRPTNLLVQPSPSPMETRHTVPLSLHSPSTQTTLQPFSTPVAYIDLFVDDFLALSQGHPGRREHVRSTLFHSVDQVFRPNTPDDSSHRREPISLSKLAKGDAKWSTRKVLLGWIIDSVAETIELPEHRRLRLLEIVQNLHNRRRVSIKQWHKALGELRSMVLAIPGGRGLFSTLQTGFTQSDKHRVRLSPPIADALEDFSYLAHDLGSRPTRLGEIVPDLPVAVGPADACGRGMGGVWLSPDPTFPPLLWRSEFPTEIQAALISDINPKGTITNSDLELAGQIAEQDILVQQRDCRERTLTTLTDNIPTRSWQRKGSTTTLGPAAYLLRLHALHQRHYRYLGLSDYIAGTANVMADDASRRWDLSDTALLAHFNLQYPQTKHWTLLHLRPAMLSALTMALQCKRSVPAQFLPEHGQKIPPGFDGATIAKNWASIPCSTMWLTPSRSSKSLPNAGELEKLLPAKNLSSLAQWKRPYVPSARRWQAWGPTTFA